jgi:beta-galactosidase
MKLNLIIILLLVICISNSYSQTVTRDLDSWKFHRGDNDEVPLKDFNDSGWETVIIPHDWAIYGPFDKEIDKQIVKIEQDNEEKATEKTGRTGALPFIGIGWYRTAVKLPDLSSGKQVLLTFDGAMSNAQVFVNGQRVGNHPYGYSYFYFDITPEIESGKENIIAVRLENKPLSSRWYPGAGLYRKVRLIIKEEENFKIWGHYITTPFISGEVAKVNIRSQVRGENLKVKTVIKDQMGNVVAENVATERFADEIEQNIAVKRPTLWSPETPYLYTAELKLYQDDVLKDSEAVRFGIREIKYSAENGFELNGKVTKFKGVCLHHDLGPIGTAVNKAALKRQLTILKDLGCNAIRSSHNMPSIEQLELCDEMGFMFMAESFDEWKKPKVQNGYHLYFDDWAEKDVVNLVHATRNHPCIVMWSAGNEVPDQVGNEGVKLAKWLQDIFHREDPTRPVTVGMDQVRDVIENGFGALLDIPGLNYRDYMYEEAYNKLPQGFILGSETASTVSSRGVYKFPVVKVADKTYDDLQCSSYDLEYCNWSNIPEDDFILQDDKPWVIGEFVWTGFDYLGEPTPYNNYWPSRSSYFGICDLAGLPKDRYYLYRSRWNTGTQTLHILPHWNWEGREGETTPVFVYTSYNSAELFVNGRSQGMRKKDIRSELTRYRLTWMDVKYEPGTLKVVAYDDAGNAVAEKSIVTAGKPHHIKLEADRSTIEANGNDLSYITATIVDKHGNPCPTASDRLYFDVKGNGKFRAACNGDATSLEVFHQPAMKAFNGRLVILVQSSSSPGNIDLTVRGDKLKREMITISSTGL